MAILNYGDWGQQTLCLVLVLARSGSVRFRLPCFWSWFCSECNVELRVNKIVGLGGGARQTDLDCGFGLVGGDKRIKNLWSWSWSVIIVGLGLGDALKTFLLVLVLVLILVRFR